MIAILTKDELLTRMLTLEVKRGGFSLSTPEKARLLLVDEETVLRRSDRQHRVTVGFSPADRVGQMGTDLILTLPYDTRALQDILHRFGGYFEKVPLEHLPGFALISGQRIPLSPGEERLFLCLFEKKGQVVSEALLKKALGGESSSNTLQVLLSRLRKKLSPDGLCRLRAVRGQGYLLSAGIAPES